jgi:hypothetical protein
MAVKQTTNFPRVEVKARISADLHRRLLEECAQCACHVNGFIAIAIAHEVAVRRRKRQTDGYLDAIAEEVSREGGANA